MQYVLTFNLPASELEQPDGPPQSSALMQPWKAYMSEMQEAGVLRGGNRLQPPWTATTVRVTNGKRHFQDGPFAETKEMASGYVVIEVHSLDEALKWAERSPSSHTGSTEVRPVAPAP